MAKPHKALSQFGRYLRQARLSTHTTQDEVAKALGTAQSLVYQYEAGVIRDPDPKLLRKMAVLYKIAHVDLVLQLVRDKYHLKAREWQLLLLSRRLKNARVQVRRLKHEVTQIESVLKRH